MSSGTAGAPSSAALPSDGADDSVEDLYEHAPCGYLSTAADGTIVRVNRTLLDWLGLERDDVVGRRRFADLLAPGPRVIWLTHSVPQLAGRGRVSGVDLDLLRHDGTRLPVLAGARLTAAAGAGHGLVRITVFDATERRAYESGLLAARATAEAAERRARTLQRVAEACATATTQEELLAQVLPAAADAWGARRAVCWFPSETGDALARAAVHGDDDPLDSDPDETGPGGSGPVRRAWETGEPALGDEHGGTALLALPVHQGDERLGVLSLLLTRTQPLDASERALLAATGALLGQAVTRTRLHAELRRMALHDSLTGLANRVLLVDRVDQASARATRTGTPLALLLLDLDGFKQINDEFGHAAGDQVLITCAGRLLGAVRDVDTVARLGGDEFAVLCDAADASAARLTAARIRSALGVPIELAGRHVVVTASVGIALQDPASPRRTAAELLGAADDAMYAAKRAGRDRAAAESSASPAPPSGSPG